MSAELTKKEIEGLVSLKDLVLIAAKGCHQDDYSIVWANADAELLGYSPNDILGHGLGKVLGEKLACEPQEDVVSREITACGLDGEESCVTAIFSFFELPTQTLCLVTLQGFNDSEASMDLLSLVLDVGDIGLWHWNSADSLMHISDSWFEMTGYPPEPVRAMLQSLSSSGLSQKEQIKHLIDWWAENVHPDDVGEAKRRVEKYLLMRITEDGYKNLYRFQHFNKHWITICSRGEAAWVNDKIKSLYIAQTEVTEMAETERRLMEKIDQLEQAQQLNWNVNAESLKKIKSRARQSLATLGVIGSTAFAVLGAMTEFGRDFLVSIREESMMTSQVVSDSAGREPLLDRKKGEILAALEKYQGHADLAIFGHYRFDGLPTGQIDYQVRRGDVSYATQDAWSILGREPYESRFETHMHGGCHTINKPANPTANSDELASVAVQVSCAVEARDLEGGKIFAFVALESGSNKHTPEDFSEDAKELSAAISQILNGENYASS